MTTVTRTRLNTFDMSRLHICPISVGSMFRDGLQVGRPCHRQRARHIRSAAGSNSNSTASLNHRSPTCCEGPCGQVEAYTGAHTDFALDETIRSSIAERNTPLFHASAICADAAKVQPSQPVIARPPKRTVGQVTTGTKNLNSKMPPVGGHCKKRRVRNVYR